MGKHCSSKTDAPHTHVCNAAFTTQGETKMHVQKNKISRSLLSILLALLLAIGMVPAVAFATGSEETVVQGSEEGDSNNTDGDTNNGAGIPENTGDTTDETGSSDIERTPGTEDSSAIEGRDLQTLASGAAGVLGTEIAPLESELSPLASPTITAKIKDDSGSWIDFTSGADDVAQMSLDNGAASKVYDVQIDLKNMPNDTTKTLSITLPIGMAWSDTGYSGNVANNVTGAPVLTKTSPASAASYVFLGGSYTYTIIENCNAMSFALKVTVDYPVYAASIANAISITYDDGSDTQTAVLESVVVSNSNYLTWFTPTQGTAFKAVARNEACSLNSSHGGFQIHNGFSDGRVSTRRLVEGINIAVELSDTRATLALASDAAIGWSVTPGGTAGAYTISYSGTLYIDAIIPPVTVTCPEPNSGAPWVDGETIELIVTSALITNKSYPGVTATGPLAPNNSNSFKRTFQILSPGEKVFVGYTSLLAAVKATDTHVNNTYSMRLPIKTEMTGLLNYYYAGNAGSADSKPKTVKITYDNTNFGVMAAFIPLPAGQTITSIRVNGTTQTVSLTSKTANRVLVTYGMLGLARDEYITSLEYTLDTIPANTFVTLASYGKHLKDAQGIATIEVMDSALDSTVTSGVSTIKTNWAEKEFPQIGFSTTSDSQVIDAGEQLHIKSIITYNGNSKVTQTENPIIYIRVEAVDEKGVPLPVSDIHLDNGAARGFVNLTQQLVIDDKVIDTSSGKVRIVKLDTKNITDGSAFTGYMSCITETDLTHATLNLSYSLSSTALTPGGTFSYSNMLYVEDPTATTSSLASSNGVSLTGSAIAAELGATGELVGLPVTTGNRYYKIDEMAAVAVTTTVKQHGSSSYETWLPGSAELQVGSKSHTTVDITTTVFNNAGAPVNEQTRLYLPIPKVGEDWGNLMSAPAAFSLELAGPVSMMAGAKGSYAVYYGENITPSDSDVTLQTRTWTQSPSDLSAVNCIMIVADSIPTGGGASFNLSINADASQQNIASEHINQLRLYYRQNVTNSSNQTFSGWYAGGYIGLQSMLGSVKGQFFYDDNENNIMDAGEEVGEVLEIKVYHKDDLVNPVQTVQTESDGSYDIDYLVEGAENYHFVVTNSDTSRRFCSVSSATGGNLFAGNSDHTVGTAAVSPELPDALGTTVATANIGVMANLTTLTWKSQDTTKGTLNGANALGSILERGNPAASISSVLGVTSKTGYTHSGWATSATGAADPLLGLTGPFGAAGAFGWSDNTYWATFTPNAYSIDFDKNDTTGIIASASQTGLTIGNTVTVPSGQTRAGYTFLGWSLNPNATAADAGLGATTSSFKLDSNRIKALYANDTTSSTTLYAVWAINHTLTYFGNSNTSGSAPAAVTQAHGSYISVATQGSLLRAGYTFSGWATSPSGSVVYGAGSQLQLMADTSLYAVWIANPTPPINTYTLSYAAGGADVTGLPSAQSNIAQGTSVIVGAAPSRTGFTFTGWSSSTGGTYQPGTSLRMPAANVVLTASWTPLTFTVTFLGYNDAELQSSTVNYGGGVTPPAEPTRNGYRFIGWDKDSSAWTNVTADATIRAMWNNESVTVTPPPSTTTPSEGTPTPVEEIAQAAEEQGIPTIGVPLAAPAGFDAWALANLILAVLSAVFVIMFAIIRGLRREDDEDDEQRRQRQGQAGTAAYAQADSQDAREEQDYIRRRRNIAWLIGAIACAVAGIILFILTQDITLPMVWVDMWTIVNAVLFVVTIVLGNMAVRRKKEHLEDEDATAATQTA